MNLIKRLALGSVQWGMDYGIANQHGVLDFNEVTKILRNAVEIGIEVLDTAAAYGRSELVLGLNNLESFKVVTKIPSFSQSKITELHIRHLEDTFKNSLKLLNCKKVYGLLVHNVEDILAPDGGRIIQSILKLKDAGFVEKIGVSVYGGQQIDDVLKKFNVDIVQLPLNILDQRMLLSGHLERLKCRGVEIHVRSVFLQGLLLLPLNKVPKFFDPIQLVLKKWHEMHNEQGLSAADACLAFLKNIPEIDRILIGVESLSQFHSNVSDFLSNSSFDAKNLHCNSEIFVNPSLWRINC